MRAHVASLAWKTCRFANMRKSRLLLFPELLKSDILTLRLTTFILSSDHLHRTGLLSRFPLSSGFTNNSAMSLPAGTELAPEKWLQHAIDAEYPMRPLPVGVVPSFDSGNTTAYQLYMTAGVCIPLVALFSSFRLLYATKFRRKIFAADQCASPFHYDRSMKDTDRGSILEVIFGLGFILCLAYIIMTLGGMSRSSYFVDPKIDSN